MTSILYKLRNRTRRAWHVLAAPFRQIPFVWALLALFVRNLRLRRTFRPGTPVTLLPHVRGPLCRTGRVVRTTPGGVLVLHDRHERGPFGWAFSEVGKAEIGRGGTGVAP